MTEPWIGIALVVATFAALLALFSIVGPLLHPEVLRKGLHMSIGLTTLSFPWLFDQPWPVVLVAAASTCAFLAFRTRFVLFRRLARAMSRIRRVSVGEYCFVLATCVVFLLASGDPVLYCIPMLLLTFADSAAALVGTRWGRHRYLTMGDYKSLEGSAAFFTIAFACIAIPLASFTTATTAEALAVAALVAFAVTVLEAAVGGGFDNLLVPPGAFAAIKATGLTVGQPAVLESGWPVVVAALSVAASLLVLLVVVVAKWRRSGVLSDPTAHD